LAREYLEDNLGRSVPLEELARLANLSPFHLARVFRDEVGMPPHAYQTQARLGCARSLLLRGWPPARVAQETGFADQSHLTRRFKRLVGVTPGRYAEGSKNVQYAGSR
jgi:AraC-like DNA-binding protein